VLCLRIVGAAACAALTLGLNAQLWASDMSLETADLLGTWHKVSGSACAAKYPAQITFDASGIYRTPDGVAAGAIWHGGDWAFQAPDHLMIQLANDRMQLYVIRAVTAGEMRLSDQDGCEILFEAA